MDIIMSIIKFLIVFEELLAVLIPVMLRFFFGDIHEIFG